MKFVFERMKVRSCLEIFTDFILDQIFVFTVRFKQNKNYLGRTIWQHLQVLQNKSLTVGD